MEDAMGRADTQVVMDVRRIIIGWRRRSKCSCRGRMRLSLYKVEGRRRRRLLNKLYYLLQRNLGLIISRHAKIAERQLRRYGDATMTDTLSAMHAVRAPPLYLAELTPT
jgi:hypothetical protein